MQQLIIRSFGYGIMSVESTGYEIDGIGKIVGYFPRVQECVWNQHEPNRFLIMVGEGHIPSDYEVEQLESDDWKWMRNIVNENGSKEFSSRLSMLEDFGTSIGLLESSHT